MMEIGNCGLELCREYFSKYEVSTSPKFSLAIARNPISKIPSLRTFRFLMIFPKLKRNYLKMIHFCAAMEQNSGLRILTQDPWECLISFVCSQNSNIVAIRSMIDKLSRNFGRKLGVHRGITFYSFPEAERLSRAKKRELMSCSVGFRWKYIKFVASKVATGELNLERLTRCDLQEIRNSLMSSVSDLTQGVGHKVADCFALFSAHRTEAFPIDIWILRCIRSRFSYELERAGLSGDFSLTPKRYFMISKLMRRKFGEYSGYAQQYLYSKVRSDSKKDGARALEQFSVTTR